MYEPREVNGIMFIGDPHLTGRKPGRRKDVDFGQTVLNKLDFLIGHCNEHKLLPCFLGDMFEYPLETEEHLKTKLARILRKSWTKAITNVGNHDKKLGSTLSDGDTLAFFAETDLITVARHSGVVETIKIGEKIVGIGATPHGQSFPLDARPYFGNVDMIIWLTHHDIAFEGSYPGAIAPQAISGCKLVVNGHMHLRKKVISVGKTVWFNPGNITRQAIDAIEHEPTVFVLKAAGNLEPVTIPHVKAIFDLTGKLIDEISPGEIRKETGIEENAESAFVNLLKVDTSLEMNQSDDGSILLEEIEDKFSREKTPDNIRSLIMGLHAAAVQ